MGATFKVRRAPWYVDLHICISTHRRVKSHEDEYRLKTTITRGHVLSWFALRRLSEYIYIRVTRMKISMRCGTCGQVCNHHEFSRTRKSGVEWDSACRQYHRSSKSYTPCQELRSRNRSELPYAALFPPSLSPFLPRQAKHYQSITPGRP